MKRLQWQLAVVGAVGVMVACSAEERTVVRDYRPSGHPVTMGRPAAADSSSRRSHRRRLARRVAARLSRSSAGGFPQTVIASEEPGSWTTRRTSTRRTRMLPQPGLYLYRVSGGIEWSLAVTIFSRA